MSVLTDYSLLETPIPGKHGFRRRLSAVGSFALSGLGADLPPCGLVDPEQEK
jgi:hypothetical protein